MGTLRIIIVKTIKYFLKKLGKENRRERKRKRKREGIKSLNKAKMKIGCSSSSSSPLLAVVSSSGSSVSWLIYAKHLFLIKHSPLLTIFQKFENFPLFVLARPVSRILGIIGVKDVIFVIMICFGFHESYQYFLLLMVWL